MSLAEAVYFAVLGPVRGWRGGTELDLGPPQQRVVLALLLARAGHLVGTQELVEALWEEPPASAVNVVHRYVSALRRLLEPDLAPRLPGRWLVRQGTSYRLDGDEASIDLLAFRRNAERARAALRRQEPDEAMRSYVEALSLSRGACADGLVTAARAYESFAAVDHEYLAVAREAADAALASTSPGKALARLRQAAARAGLDEPLQARWILVLAAAGFRAEALEVYQLVRQRLADELGVDPGAELQEAYRSVLREPAARPEPPVIRPAQLPPDLSTFVSRSEELVLVRDLLPPSPTAMTTILITAIDGMAGVGKTALAVHWAHRVADRFPDGQLYVNLRGFDPAGPAGDPGRGAARLSRRARRAGRSASRPAWTRRSGCTAACWPAGGCWWCWTTPATPSRCARCCPARPAAWSW